jgi:HEAT repeat protein
MEISAAVVVAACPCACARDLTAPLALLPRRVWTGAKQCLLMAAVAMAIAAFEPLNAGASNKSNSVDRTLAPRARHANPPAAALPPLEKAAWLWHPDATLSLCHLRRTFTLESPPLAATLLITADNGYALYVNGSLVGQDAGAASEVWRSVERYDIRSLLAPGRNILGIVGSDLGGERGVVAALRIEFKNRPALELVTDTAWRAAAAGDPRDYSHPEFVEGPLWKDARVMGPMGMAPWGNLAWSEATDRRPEGNRGAPALSRPQKRFRWPDRIVFLGEDCSVYVPLRGDAWGVCFRVGDWSRAYTEFDLPCPSKIGRKLYSLKPGPKAKPQLLLDAGPGVIGSPAASFDGRFLFLAMATDGEKFFHIYRMPADGGAPVRLTDGPFHDIDPAELPDGRVVFTSTRIGTFEEYHSPPSRALFVMNADGGGIHPITFTPIFDNEPKVLADGRIVFVRSDNFFDRAKVETHLHVIHPDGTDGLTEFGADVGADYGVRLRALGYGSPAPLPDGRLAFISNRGNFVAAMGSAERDYHRLPDSLGDVAALPDGRLLATVLRPDGARTTSDVIAVIDPHDNRIVPIYISTNGPVHSPVSLARRAPPPILPDFAAAQASRASKPTGFLFCQNARFTRKTRADWLQIKAIRVLGAVPLTVRSSHSHIVHAGHETVELGTVPLAPDGSFFVEVPADMPLAFQAVDAEGRSELNEMSWIYVRPGEHRSCLGCHQPRQAAPAAGARPGLALRSPPLRLLGQGDPHRFRGNNPGVTGMMDLQFERFRECASLNLHPPGAGPLATGGEDAAALQRLLGGTNQALKISAAQRLALFRSRSAAPALAAGLRDNDREVRVATALALAGCGTRDSVPPLLAALEDADALVAQAANVALENLTGRMTTPGVEEAETSCAERAAGWRRWFAGNSWDIIEQSLIRLLPDGVSVAPESPEIRAAQRRAAVALGHIGGGPARAALRVCLGALQNPDRNPYPVFENDNRTDSFTFAADSGLNPRTLQEIVRAIGQLQDAEAVPLLGAVLRRNIDPRAGNLFLAEAAVEALGRVGTSAAEELLVDTFGRLKDYWQYVGWYSDHPALYACHSSPLHARLIEALDALGSTRGGPLVPGLIRSLPTDPDRALFPQNDDYETLVGRIIRRSGRGAEVTETCLAILGDPQARVSEAIKTALSTTHAAWAGQPGPENRSAQVLSLVCRENACEPRLRAAFERFRALPEEPVHRELGNPTWTPVRHWVLFYLGRALGNLADPRSFDALAAALADDLNEARHGRPDPSQPEIHFLQLEYTPAWRAAAAWALGRLGERRATPILLGVVANLDNAVDVRHTAACALAALADGGALPQLTKLAENYPEISTQRALGVARDAAAGPSHAAPDLARREAGH